MMNNVNRMRLFFGIEFTKFDNDLGVWY